MKWNWSKRWFGRRDDGAEEGGTTELPPVRWLGPTHNPWGVPVLDVRPVTLGMVATSADPRCAANAISFAGDDGTGFIGVEPRVARRVTAGLRFRVDGMLLDGALFLPGEMEQKWAVFFHRGRSSACGAGCARWKWWPTPGSTATSWR